MKRFFVSVLRALLNARYRRYAKRPCRNAILFLSRQSNKLSQDFALLKDAAAKLPGWECITCVKMLDGGLAAKVGYALHMLREVKLLAQCRICFVEGYNPALSLLDMQSCELGGGARNSTVPVEPVVIQLWHATGMYKRFGFLATGTSEGRSEEDAQLFCMHRNYSWIVTSGESAREPYAQALGYPVERCVALGHPSCDLLYGDPAPAQKRAQERYPQLVGHKKPVILFAPTLHRTQEETSFDELRRALEASPWSQDYELIWSYHPVLTPGDTGRAPTSVLLRSADLLVTDYSSIVYDAALLKCPVAFYVPDIDEYRASPGLISDPVASSPQVCQSTPQKFMDFADACLKRGEYPQEALDAFIGDSLSACQPGSTQRILDFALRQAEVDGAGEGTESATAAIAQEVTAVSVAAVDGGESTAAHEAVGAEAVLAAESTPIVANTIATAESE